MKSGGLRAAAAFTLIELMTATAILIMLLGIIFVAINETGKIWRRSSDRIESFQDARTAFETITRKLGQATLNTYYDYFDQNGKPLGSYANPATFIPGKYGRQSELHFLTGKTLVSQFGGSGEKQVGHSVFFQAPLGEADADYEKLSSLLNACGYFVVFAGNKSDSSLSGRPAFLDGNTGFDRYRYCLMELCQPAEQLKIYDPSVNPSDSNAQKEWFRAPLRQNPPRARVLAENIIALIIQPKEPDLDAASATDPIGSDFEYDSRMPWSGGHQPKQMNQLCPALKVTMVAVDETAMQRLQGSSPAPPDFGLSALFQRADKLEADLKTLESTLSAKGLGYRIFQTEVPLRNSKWSTNTSS